MAKLDLTGLMTGLPTDQDLRTQGQARAAQIQGGGLGSNLARGIASRAPQREEMMRQGLGGMFGVDTRTGDQQQTARMQQALSGLKLDTPEGLMQLARIQQSTGDMAGAARSTAVAQAMVERDTAKTKETNISNGLLKMARSQGNENMVKWLESGGDSKTAASVLLKQPKLATPESFTMMYDTTGNPVKTAVVDGQLVRTTENGWTAVTSTDKLTAKAPEKPTSKPSDLSNSDVETYDALVAEDKTLLPAVSVLGKVWGTNISNTKKRALYALAEEIYTNNSSLGRAGALAQAANMEEPNTNNAKTTIGKFDNVTEKEA